MEAYASLLQRAAEVSGWQTRLPWPADSGQAQPRPAPLAVGQQAAAARLPVFEAIVRRQRWLMARDILQAVALVSVVAGMLSTLMR